MHTAPVINLSRRMRWGARGGSKHEGAPSPFLRRSPAAAQATSRGDTQQVSPWGSRCLGASLVPSEWSATVGARRRLQSRRLHLSFGRTCCPPFATLEGRRESGKGRGSDGAFFDPLSHSPCFLWFFCSCLLSSAFASRAAFGCC